MPLYTFVKIRLIRRSLNSFPTDHDCAPLWHGCNWNKTIDQNRRHPKAGF
jgi:hypothetical protein